jgi:hypothetical protein
MKGYHTQQNSRNKPHQNVAQKTRKNGAVYYSASHLQKIEEYCKQSQWYKIIIVLN